MRRVVWIMERRTLCLLIPTEWGEWRAKEVLHKKSDLRFYKNTSYVEYRAATAERELDGVRTYARNQASLPYYIPGGRDAGEHWQEALNEIASPVMRWSPPPEPATCATCEGYGYVNPGLHEKDCPDCTTQPASVADGGKETK